MSILIKGMEMQGNCGWCPLRGSCVHRIYIECRPEDCPLIEVPEPHGDLIDRDALPKPRVEWEDIVNAPTIIPASEEAE